MHRQDYLEKDEEQNTKLYKYYYFFRGHGNFHNFAANLQKRFYVQNFVFCTRIWYNFL